MPRLSFGQRLQRSLWWVPLGHVADLSAAELSGRLAGDLPPQLLDVRTRAEWRRSHIARSVNVPITELRRRLPELNLDPNAPIVAICLSAHRSIPAVRLLRSCGFRDVAQLKGGMRAWWRAELGTQAELR